MTSPTTAQQDNALDVLTAQVSRIDYVPFPREDLPVGTQLRFSLYDGRGVLLLAKGSLVTPRFLENLRKQNVCTVHIAERELSEIAGQTQGTQSEATNQLFAIHTETTRLLDQLLEDERALSFTGAGAPFENEVVRRLGAKPYDAKLSQHVVENEILSLATVADLLHDILNFRKGVKAQHQVARNYMNVMKQDLDLVVASATVSEQTKSIQRHSLQMCILGMAVATELGFDAHQVFIVGLTGLLHDVGMMKVPKSVFNAKGPLSVSQYLDVMRHVIHSADLLEDLPGVPNPTRLASYQVHERWNGRGYPRRRMKTQIHAIARILGIVDAYLTYISPSFGRKPLLPYAGIVSMLHQAKKGYFDPSVVRALLAVLSLYPIGSSVILSDGRAGKIIRSNGEQYDRPVVQILYGVDGDKVRGSEIVDLASETDLSVVQAIREIAG